MIPRVSTTDMANGRFGCRKRRCGQTNLLVFVVRQKDPDRRASVQGRAADVRPAIRCYPTIATQELEILQEVPVSATR